MGSSSSCFSRRVVWRNFSNWSKSFSQDKRKTNSDDGEKDDDVDEKDGYITKSGGKRIQRKRRD